MHNRRFFLIIALALTAFLCGAFTLQAASIKERMLARIPAINALKDKGTIGENNRGFLEFRTGDNSQQKLISEENKDRKSVYAAIATKQKVDVTLVGQRRAKQISDKGTKGHWYQKSDGTWYRK
ncbi:MAG: YdbL family protein [Desulfofustis sp.]|nr:YdbL family protein [Desulfofustis sp.]